MKFNLHNQIVNNAIKLHVNMLSFQGNNEITTNSLPFRMFRVVFSPHSLMLWLSFFCCSLARVQQDQNKQTNTRTTKTQKVVAPSFNKINTNKRTVRQTTKTQRVVIHSCYGCLPSVALWPGLNKTKTNKQTNKQPNKQTDSHKITKTQRVVIHSCYSCLPSVALWPGLNKTKTNKQTNNQTNRQTVTK